VRTKIFETMRMADFEESLRMLGKTGEVTRRSPGLAELIEGIQQLPPK
jgi:hypothetical protein